MKIIKVVHANDAGELNAERELFTINQYDVESFLSGNETLKQLDEEFSKEINSIVNTYIRNILLPPLSFFTPMKITMIAKIAIRRVIADLLQDIAAKSARIEVLSLEIAREKYPKTRNLSVGTYTLHPRESQQITRLEHYHKNLALEKDDELIVLLGKMGAKSLRIVESDSQEDSGSGSLVIDVVNIASTESSMNLSRKVNGSKDLIVNFEGNVVDIDPDLLEKSLWFSDDSRLISIFESRRFNPNKIKEYTLKNTYTETFDFDFKLAAKYLVFEADLKAEYQSISNKERFFHVEFSR